VKKKVFLLSVCQKIKYLIYLRSDVVNLYNFDFFLFFFFLVNFDFICQLDITSLNITLIKDLAFIMVFIIYV